LVIREKFRRVGWRRPNHKPSTKIVVARAKSLWDKYVTADDLYVVETWIDWIHRTMEKKTHETISQLWKWLCQAYSLLAKESMDSYTLEQVRRVRAIPSVNG
jgi:hypothetical protein